MEVREVSPSDRDEVRRVVAEEWGLPVVSISGVHDPASLPGFVAEEDGELLGLVTFRFDDAGCEVVTLNALEPDKGVGTALLTAVKALADSRGARLWLITTDDNLAALDFYQRRGMDIVTLHRGFGDVVRSHKPGVQAPEGGAVPLRHAFELSF